MDRIPDVVHVVSTFEFCLVAGLLRNKKIPDELINSAGFMAISEGAKNLSFGAKTSQDSEELVSLLTERSARINSLEGELNTEAILDDSSLPNSPCCSCTPLSSSSSSCSSIDDTKSRPDLGTINKKRQVLKRCRKITAVLDDVSESFLYGTDGEREKVQGIISEVIDLIVTKSKGSRNGLTELLSPQTLTNVFQGMRVPDWVLLFFKLQTRLPDSAWQTLLNLTRLGKNGRAGDTPVLLTKNEIMALKKLVFSTVQKTFKIARVKDADFDA
ncbi:unnamed protein product [Pocillopora meandrina]|uniref:Uncharacterized protein n=1 Tax=Pocillopora meandrina TaxID=46732 RepID=A0AAU9XGY9_9CNID|nr:unnamed protein product [Pocillopora meandrina]